MQWKWRIQGIRSDGVCEELWTDVHDIVQEAGIKTIPKKKECKKAEWLQSKSLQAINAGEGVEKREPSYTDGGNAN